ncbi:MAG: S41 family peptidase [Ignavibacteriaceae bacterium]|nr:S41 family peptidase [Ignavibacteriaceae bacterium]
MNFKKLRFIAVPVFIVLLFSGFSGMGDIYLEISKNIELFSRVYKEISYNYVDEIDPEQFMRAGIMGMLSSLDPYTIFIDEKKKEDIDLITNGKYGGIGISIGVRGKQVTVVEVMDGYSAQRQGIKIGDIIIEAAGVAINSDNVDEISSLVKGEPGSTVELRIIRNEYSDTLDFNIVREEVIVKNLTYAGFYPDNGNTVYLKLSNFSRAASDEIKIALRQLKSEKKIESIILDLRGNPGGLLDIAVDICDKFLQKDQLIVTTRGRDVSSERNYYSVQEPMIGDAKLVVLINGGSASASEIVAGAIQDHDRGLILGTKSFGKGLVQTITTLNFNTSLKITTAKYYTPSGRCIQKIDYSENSDVIKDDSIESDYKYFTDSKRQVYSKGGITPDSTVKFSINGNITKELLAQGFFFHFANYYSFNNPNQDFNKISDDELLTQFKDYIDSEDFEYHSKAEKEIDILINDISESEEPLSEELKTIKAKLHELDKSEFVIYKDEIRMTVMTELASRYLGLEGRIKERLKTDTQVQSALGILENVEVYDDLLNSH